MPKEKAPVQSSEPKSDTPETPKAVTPAGQIVADTPVDPKAKTPTGEELAAIADERMARLMGSKPSKKKDAPVAAVTSPESEPALIEEPGTVVPAVPPADPKAEAKPKSRIEKLLEAPMPEPAAVAPVAAPAAQPAATPASAPQSPQAPSQDEPGLQLNRDEQALLDAYTVLEQMAPRYQGMRKRILDWWKKDADYRTKWADEHPDESFDDASPSYQRFQEANAPAYEEADFETAQQHLERARIDSIAHQQAREIHDREVAPKLLQIEAERAFERERPNIARAANEDTVSFISKVLPDDLLGAIKEGDQLTITPEGLQKLETSDPDLMELVYGELEELRILSGEIKRLDSMPQYYKLNPAMWADTKNGPIQPHVEIISYSEKLERRIARAPADAQKDEGGKTFISHNALSMQQQAILQKRITDDQKRSELEVLKAKHWTVNGDMIREYIVNEKANQLKKIVGFAQKKSKSAAPAIPGTATPPTAKARLTKGDEPGKVVPFPKPPSTASASENVNNPTTASKKVDLTPETMVSKMFGI